MNLDSAVTRCVASLVAAMSVWGCAQEPLSGTITTASGQSILSLSLADGRVEQIHYEPAVILRVASRIDAQRVLVTVQSLRQMSERTIMIYDLRRGGLEAYADGSHAAYLPAHEKVVLYDHPRLYMADLERDADSEPVLIDQDPVQSFPTYIPVPVSDDEFLYRSSRDGGDGIWKYHIPTRSTVKLEQLDGCMSSGFWVPERGQLLCIPYSGVEYWTGLDGSGRVETDFLDSGDENRIISPIGYVPELNGMIYQYTTFSFLRMEEISPVWLYELDTGNHRRIAGNLAAFGIAYFD